MPSCELGFFKAGDALSAGRKWPPWLGESFATGMTWYGCYVPKIGCVKYEPEKTVRNLYTQFLRRFRLHIRMFDRIVFSADSLMGFNHSPFQLVCRQSRRQPHRGGQ